MRKIVIDFEFTVLWPLILFVLIVLWNSIRTYLRPSAEREYWLPSENRGHEFAENDAQQKVNDARWHLRDAEWELGELEWKQRRHEEKRKAKNLAWVSAIVLAVLCTVMSLGDKWKAPISEPAWDAVGFISALAFIITIPVAWDYARKLDWLRLAACLLTMLITAASYEHSLHQSMNAHHANCPRCTDDDQPDDNQ